MTILLDFYTACSKSVTDYGTQNLYASTVYRIFNRVERCKSYNTFTTNQNKINGASLQQR